MDEQYLFEMNCNPTVLLASLARQGFVFLTPKQVCSLLSKTWGQVRYAIQSYELDAYIIDGEYRFTLQAVSDYIDNVQEKYEAIYHSTMQRIELSGVYALTQGTDISAAVRSLKQHGYPISSIDTLLDKRRRYKYDELEEGNTEILDFYDIPSLDIPESLYVWELANLLQMEEMRIARNIGKPLDEILGYPTVYDYLVSKQYVNANVPMNLNGSQKDINESGQLYLGL